MSQSDFSFFGSPRAELIGALVGLSRATDIAPATPSTHRVMIQGLYASLPSGDLRPEVVAETLRLVRQEKDVLSPGCSSCASPCGRTADYELSRLWTSSEEVRSLKLALLLGLQSLAAYAYPRLLEGDPDPAVPQALSDGLFALGEDTMTVDQLLPFVQKLGEALPFVIGKAQPPA